MPGHLCAHPSSTQLITKLFLVCDMKTGSWVVGRHSLPLSHRAESCLPKPHVLPPPVQLAVNAVVQKAKSHESLEVSLAQMLGLLFCQLLSRAKAPPLVSGCLSHSAHAVPRMGLVS